MKKMEVWLPIYAAAKFSVPKHDYWDELDAEEKANYVLENLSRSSSICHQCAHEIETDFEVDIVSAESQLLTQYESENELK